jgi:alginate O-acetyltransferase complex protein AlgI
MLAGLIPFIDQLQNISLKSYLPSWIPKPETLLFCSLPFAAFFSCVFIVYWLLPWKRARVYLLLAASFAFYACWNEWLAILITFTTMLDYFLARAMEGSASDLRRKAMVILSLVVNLGLLCYFKYANFFLRSVEDACRAAGWSASMPLLQVILPFGISFYTFEAINYTIDVYRRKVPAERNLANFMLFILFFPHLIAGPIVRSRDFLPQTRRTKRWNWARMELGVQFFLMGMFKKLVIADRLGEYFVKPVFDDPSEFGTTATWLAVVAYALQIYGDFSGYTDMALGTAHLLGYKLAQNFNMPYFAANVSEFWRRWHISLSSWLRDYLFIPLGGSRGSNWQTNRNLMITMALGGLWHGASWTFIVWGILHGLFLTVHRGFRDFCKTRPRLDYALQSPPGTVLCVLTTFLSVSVGWVFFGSKTFAGAATILHRMVVPHAGQGVLIAKSSLWATIAVLIICHFVAQRGWWTKLAPRLPAPALGFGYAVLLSLTFVLAPDSGKAFIYFQF